MSRHDSESCFEPKMSKSTSPQEQMLRRQLNAIAANTFDRLEVLHTEDSELARRALGLVLQFACEPSHMGGIMAGRAAFNRIAQDWMRLNIDQAISESLDLNDPWIYRRLLELLKPNENGLLRKYVEYGHRSSEPEVREAAEDFDEEK